MKRSRSKGIRFRLRTPHRPDSETLERLKRWPSLMARFEGKKVYIWSAEHEAYWRANGGGYTSDGLQAGVYEFDDAFRRTRSCGPEKRIDYRLVGQK